MDTTIIAAIISALVTALIAIKLSASRDREQLETRAQAAAIIAKRVSKTEEPEERAFLEENLELLGKAGEATTGRSKQAEIAVSPGEHKLLFVVQKDNPRPAFNILTRLSNNG